MSARCAPAGQRARTVRCDRGDGRGDDGSEEGLHCEAEVTALGGLGREVESEFTAVPQPRAPAFIPRRPLREFELSRSGSQPSHAARVLWQGRRCVWMTTGTEKPKVQNACRKRRRPWRDLCGLSSARARRPSALPIIHAN